MQAQAQALLALGPKAVLLKGGHGEGSDAVDILVARGAAPVRLALPRIDTAQHARHRLHAIGRHRRRPGAAASCCAMPSVAAKRFVHAALAAGRGLKIGGGSGPVDHLHALRGSRKP